MKQEKEFRKQCPKCQEKFKIVKKCRACHFYCCIECSIKELCIDCYTDLKEINEHDIYFGEKQKHIKVMDNHIQIGEMQFPKNTPKPEIVQAIEEYGL